MKKIVFVLIGIFTAMTAVALNLPPTSKEAAYFNPHNKLINPGAENGTSKVTISAGTLTATTLSAELGMGARAFKWCPAASGNTLSFSQYVVETGLKSNNGQATALALTSGTGYAMRVFDGTNVLSSTSTLTPSSSYQNWSDNFVYPSSGSLTINAIAGNPSNCLFLDDAYLGKPTNVGTVSQAQFVGSAYFATTAACTWSRSNTALGAFGTDADCPAPTIEHQQVGVWQTTDADLPKITINSLPPGLYTVTVTAYTACAAGNPDATIAINDGTTTSGQTGAACSVDGYLPVTVKGNFSYSTAGNRTFEVYTSSGSSTLFLNNSGNNVRTTFVIEKYPLQAQTLVASDQGDYGWTSYTPTFTGFGTPTGVNCYHSRSAENLNVRCTFVPGTTTATEARVSFPGVLTSSSAIPTLELAGTAVINVTSNGYSSVLREPSVSYFTFGRDGGGSTAYVKFNGSSWVLSGNTVSFHASVPINGWVQNQRAPALINSVLSNYNGSLSVASARLSASCVVSEEDGDWIASTADNGTGDCTMTFNTGIFSAAPKCFFSVEATNAAINAGQSKISLTTTPSATTLRYTVTNSGGTLSDLPVSVFCVGPR